MGSVKDPKAKGDNGHDVFARTASAITDEMLLSIYRAHVAVIWRIAAVYLNERNGKKGHFSIVKDEESKTVGAEIFKLRCALIHDKQCESPKTVARFAFVPRDGYYDIFAMNKNRGGKYVRAPKPLISTQEIDSLRPDMLSTLPALYPHLNKKAEQFLESHRGSGVSPKVEGRRLES